MKKDKYLIIIFILMLVVSLVSCDNGNSEGKPDLDLLETNTSTPPEISIEPIDESPYVDIYLPVYAKDTDYEAWSSFFLNEFGIDIGVNTKEKTDLKDTADMSYDFDMDDKANVYGQMHWIWNDWEKGNTYREGIYLVNVWGYGFFHQMTLNYNQKEPEEGWEETGTVLFQPWNKYTVCNYLPPFILDAYTDDAGNVWALPYEYKYPEVKIRKYNKEILEKLGKDIPEDIFELYELLKAVKNESAIDNILPSMKRDSVFSGFEDIVNAFGIKTSVYSDIESFYSIQYDEEIGNYRDLAFDSNMKQCIEYFVMLLDQGLISLDYRTKDQNDEFHNGNIFSVYDKVVKKEDLLIPYSEKLYAYDYEPVLYYQPSRYLYTLGAGQEYDLLIEDVMNAFYTSSETKLAARYGEKSEDFNLLDSRIAITEENFYKAPRLIGEFPDDKYKLDGFSELDKFKERVRKNNIDSGYYKILTPQSGMMESFYNMTKTGEYWTDQLGKDQCNIFAHTFYRILGDYFFNVDRPSVDEFLLEYRNEMKRQIDTARMDGINWWFTAGYWLDMDFKY